jgi:hypothetical protein
MLLLEESGKGYNMNDENECIPVGTYADDMVLHTNINIDLQYLFDECNDYFDFIGLNISYNDKEKDKTIYTNNTNRYDTLHFDKKDSNRNILRKYVPYNSRKESYKYLGIWINLELWYGMVWYLFSGTLAYIYRSFLSQ